MSRAGDRQGTTAAALAVATALYGVVSGWWYVATPLLALQLGAPLVRARLDLGATAQLVTAVLSTLGALLLASVLLDALAPEPLGPIAHGVAMVALLVATFRLWMAAPWEGARVTVAIGLLVIVAAGRARSGPIYPVLAMSYLGLAWLAMVRSDPGRVSWVRMTGRTRRLTAWLLGISAVLATAGALVLPPLHAWAVRLAPLGGGSGQATSGFSGGHMRLGALQGMLMSDEVVMRIEGAPVDHLRGAVFRHYLRGRWVVRREDRPRAFREPVDASRATSGAPETTIRLVGGGDNRYFLPLGAVDLKPLGDARDGYLRRNEVGIVWPPPGEDAEAIRFSVGAVPAAVAAPDHWDRQLPERVAEPLRRLAQSFTRGQETPEARVEAIVARLRSDYRYALSFDRTDDIDPVLDFLLTHREGHCEYFASAGALLLRAAGVPARVVGGYVVTETNPIGGYQVVRERNAHAWVEAWLGGRWVTVDPTPPGAVEAHMATETGAFAALLDLVGTWITGAVDWVADRSAVELAGMMSGLLLFWAGLRLFRRRREGAGEAPDGAIATFAAAHPALQALEAALASQGLERGRSEPLERFAQRVRGSTRLAEDSGATAALLARYAAWRYGGHGDPEALTADLAAAAARLRR